MADRVEVDLDRYDSETISKAFWLQEYIRRHGIDGIHYMFHARTVARNEGPRDLADNISNEFRRL